MPFKLMVYQAYNENKHMLVNSHKSSWLKGINNLLKYCSLGDIFTNKIHSINKQEKNNFSNLTMENVKQMYINDWQNIIKKENSKLRTYSLFKNEFEMEKYLLHVKDKNVRSCFTKLRISSHKLMIETGRYNRPQKIPVNERYCNYCKNNNFEDEIHFVLTCKLFETERELFHKKLYEFVLFDEKLSVNDLFTTVMSNSDYDICELFTKFIYECYEKRKKITFRDQ